MIDLNKITVIDDFFEENIRSDIWERIGPEVSKWRFRGGNRINRFWHIDFLEYDEYFSVYLKNEICNRLGDFFENALSVGYMQMVRLLVRQELLIRMMEI